MLVARFNETTEWAGKTIAFENGGFVLDGHGPISAVHVMEYDRQGLLVWASDGTRAWVGSKAKAAPATRVATPATGVTPAATSPAAAATTGVDSRQSSPRDHPYLKRGLMAAIAVLVVANVVILLFLVGVFHTP
jgi:hypothetical protein